MARGFLVVLCLLSVHCEALTRPSEVHFVPADGFDIAASLDGADTGSEDVMAVDALDDALADGMIAEACVEMCDAGCVDLGQNPLHCGACGIACVGGALCVMGTCSATCASGTANCDGNPMNGCESTLAIDVANCGSCGNHCTAGPNATATCMRGICGIRCMAGALNCDGNTTNGCEAMDSQSNSCGGCGMMCNTSGAACVATGGTHRCCFPPPTVACLDARCTSGFTCQGATGSMACCR